MSNLLLFTVGVAVFAVTLMAVLWTGYLVMADRFDADQVRRPDQSFDPRATLAEVPPPGEPGVSDQPRHPA